VKEVEENDSTIKPAEVAINQQVELKRGDNTTIESVQEVLHPTEIAIDEKLEVKRIQYSPTIELFSAVRAQDLRRVEIALKNNARPNLQNSLGETPLHIAASLGNKDIADILCIYSTDVDCPNNFGDTPLHYGSRFPEIVHLLVKEWDADTTILNQENCSYLTWDKYADRMAASQCTENQ